MNIEYLFNYKVHKGFTKDTMEEHFPASPSIPLLGEREVLGILLNIEY